MESNWWFVPEILGDELNNLRPLPDEHINGSQEIKKASALTIYLQAVRQKYKEFIIIRIENQ
jgi:hypothetical protein